METNEVLDKLPKHLMDLVIDQPYNEYTAQDHAVWRYVMRQNVHYLPKVAHGSYVQGLEQTGISIDSIPHMYGMNRILREIGWAAVAVDGFIPPAAFMEFQAYNVLVIAADIRPIDQIGYTPAPDIIHEAAGHAPIIADPEYAQYLMNFGKVGAKAFSSALDYKIYEAIRYLSILKANPYSSAESISKAMEKLEQLEKEFQEPSEMNRLRNLHWWTVEYGLIGDINKPKIYGAGLLSSIDESVSCLKETVKKLPYSIEAADYSFDITNQQPQLFVTPDFKNLDEVLDEFTKTLSYKKGGLYGVNQAIKSENIATVEFSSGLQVSGVFSEVIQYMDSPAYIKTSGKTSLASDNKELEGHSVNYHKDGFGSPCGLLKSHSKPIEVFDHADMESLSLLEGRKANLEFESGVNVQGVLLKKETNKGKVVLLTFRDCIVKYRGQILFKPEWGLYDMAVGSEITSVYSGPADPEAYGFRFPELKDKTIKIDHDEQAQKLHNLYKSVQKIRENGVKSNELEKLWNKVKRYFPNEWLIQLEIIEILGQNGQSELISSITKNLDELKREKDVKKLIDDGLKLFS